MFIKYSLHLIGIYTTRNHLREAERVIHFASFEALRILHTEQQWNSWITES